MSKLPFKNTTKFPLNGITFGSRVQSHIDSNKNYILLGFKPGFPLQASELNEIQEHFFVQQTLTTEMVFNWANNGLSGPAWQGATPIKPELLDRTSSTVVLSPGWLFIKNQNFIGGMGTWIYNPNSYSFSVNTGSDTTYGIAVKIEEISATTDTSLNDNSGGNRNIYSVSRTEGANRIKVVIDTVSYNSSSTIPTGYIYMPIIKTLAITAPPLLSTEVYTINNYKVT
jgi:hypothetical protein